MSCDLLDLPLELFQRVVHELVNEAGIAKAWKLRSVCRKLDRLTSLMAPTNANRDAGTFAVEIHNDIFKYQPIEEISKIAKHTYHRRILEPNLKLYLRNQLNSSFKPDNEVVSMLQKSLMYLVETFKIKDLGERHDLVAQLVDGRAWDIPKCFYCLGYYHHSGELDDGIRTGQKLRAAVAVGAENLVGPLIVALRAETTVEFYATPDDELRISIFGSPLGIAIEQSNTDMVRTLIHEYKKVYKHIPVEVLVDISVGHVIRIGNMEILELLISFCRPQDGHRIFRGSRFNSWVREAVLSNSVVAVDTVLSSKPRRQGMLAQEVAIMICQYGSIEMITHYLQHGLDINKTYQKTSPLIAAVKSGCTRRVADILSAGADINKAAGDGSTALFYAAKFSRGHIAQYLLDYGADTNMDKWPQMIGTNKAKIFLKDMMNEY